MRFDNDKVVEALKSQGAIVVPECLEPATVAQVLDELAPWLRQIAFNDVYGYSFRQADKWLHHLGMCSPAAIQLAVHEKTLDLLEKIFGEPAILAQISYQEKIDAEAHLPMHCDGDGGILIFFYLTDLKSEDGNTRFIPGTQEIRLETLIIPKDQYAGRENEIISVEGKAGTALFFDQDVWHDRLAVKTGGRKVMWALYHPESHAYLAFDQPYRQSILSGLNARQLRAIGIGQKPFSNPGIFRNIGRDYNKSDLKIFLRYLFKFKHLEWKPSAQTIGYMDKKISNISRVRAWHSSKGDKTS